jgi:hypothetical protein
MLNQNLKNDITFWENYLNDTALITLPKSAIIIDMKHIPYSTYQALPSLLMENVLETCMQHAVSITDFLCASITLALKSVASGSNKNVYINIIRSIRDNEIHDQMLGCFLRLDPIKVDLTSDLNIIELAKAIQQSRVMTEPYQACSGMVKLACLPQSNRKKLFKNFIINSSSALYCKLFQQLKLNPTMLSMYAHLRSLRAKQLKTKHKFLVNVNLLNNFIMAKNSATLFGMPLTKSKLHEFDFSKIDNVLDICFLKNDQDKLYLVISSNLTVSFRKQLGNEIIKHICMLSHFNNFNKINANESENEETTVLTT